MIRTIAASAALVLVGGVVHAQTPAVTNAACEQLAASLKLPHTTVTSAQAVPAGHYTPPGARQAIAGLPAFCRVALTLKPSSDSDIKSEIWMPLSGWNGKFQQVGNGAWGGSIQYAALADGLRRGFAMASTDTGHAGPDASFAVGHPEKLVDFGWRAVHETAVQGKATAKALYGSAPRLSYFNGCSGGGRQAFMAAQRFPEDYDAIIAGAPGYNRIDVGFQTIGMIQATHKEPGSLIPVAKQQMLHRAAVNACDAHDGLTDGLIDDPRSCRFDPGTVACKAGDAASCLTAPQVEAARRIYAPVVDPRSGNRIADGLEPGSELHWESVAGANAHAMYNDMFRFVVFQDPNWDFRTLDVATHLDRARKADAGVLVASSTDLRPFTSRGGKLLIYHGWEDQNIPPRGSISYYEGVVKTMGRDATNAAVRLYMVPGMGHCGGGDGPNTFDMVGALDEWRDQGRAPAAIVASKSENGKVVRTRPLCPYPQVARYKGTGSIDSAENFSCVAP
ncbi:MAG: tannase/feruloyl esterase family alpha/beta hydrolase [Acidimicrobiia bacterium]|nr:tannase/feruloyl esterase family alpha/beta hydrolase [Acidimicrobiia bacterium]